MRNLTIQDINSRLKEFSVYRAARLVPATPSDARVNAVVCDVQGDGWDGKIMLDDRMRAFIRLSNGQVVQCEPTDLAHSPHHQELVDDLFEYDVRDCQWGRMNQLELV